MGESVSQPLLYYQVNVQGTLNLIASMLATGCRNIVFSSSATVYGEPASVPVDESFPVGACTNPYGAVFTACMAVATTQPMPPRTVTELAPDVIAQSVHYTLTSPASVGSAPAVQQGSPSTSTNRFYATARRPILS